MPVAERLSLYAAKERMESLAARYPVAFYALNGLQRKNHTLALNRETELVIEAFPRSANIFAVVAFEYAQPRKVRIAHHLHSQAQIARAAEWQIPTIEFSSSFSGEENT